MMEKQVTNKAEGCVDKNQQRATLLTLLQAMDKQGSWCGETHVQKCVFVLQDGLDVPLGMEFVLYKHGPFSFDLRQTLGEMRGDLLIEAKLREPFGPSLTVSDSGRTFLQRHAESASGSTRKIEFVAEQLGPRSVVALERLGTALLVKRDEPTLNPEARAVRMTVLKPHIRPDQAREAVDEVERLLAQAAEADSRS